MRVALIKPPIGGHGSRGVGFYGQRLFDALKNLVDIKWVDFSYLPPTGFDVIHYPYFDFFWPTLSPVRLSKTVVTIHDVIPLKFPQYYPLGIRAKVVLPWQKFLLKNVDAVITDSDCSRRDIREMVGIGNVHVTYLAADPAFRPLNIARKKFVLYVGGGNWNKNVISLVKACQKAKIPLIMVGKEFMKTPVFHVETESLREVRKYIDGNNVTARGFAETQELVKLYNQAKVYVQPSVYEGFGLPVLEAMACGTPVICGKNSSLTEIAGNAATFADVTNVDDLADKIMKVKPTDREISQAAKFSWEKTAKETYEIYSKILKRD